MAGLFQKSPLKKDDSYRELLERAQKGEAEAREQLIGSYTPFVLRVLSQKTGRYFRVGEDDEVSIGLIALNEAINTFDPKKSSNFLAFAETTIRSRLIDYYRKENRNSKVVPISALESDDEGNQDRLSLLTARQALAEFQAKGEAADRRSEIVAYAQVLKEYGISFAELVEISPKHDDARRRAVEAAYLIAE
ncbi:MAG TPA: sigma-70 family RNA polymerase sigma factor, partial [Bacillota bacterium]|nr:sigma-70 family RNA polymerase sigma factor [Bacillota bacterium]